MDISRIRQNIGEIAGKTDRKKIIVFLGVAGMILILLSELIPDKAVNKEENKAQNDDITSDQYKHQLEDELGEILSSIEGVGKTSIMITLDGTTEYVYAEELDTTTDSNENSKRESYRSNLVITESGGDKKALVKKIIRPQVTGVLVACYGGDDIHIKEKIIGAVSAVLNIPAGRVYVVKLSD